MQNQKITISVHSTMKFAIAFALLASAVSAAPHIVQLEMRDDCVGKRFAVFAIDNSNTVDKQDPDNVRYEVPRKVFEKMSPEADKGAVLIGSWNEGNRVAAPLGPVNNLRWDTPAPGRGDVKADELVVAATTHMNNVPEEFKDHTAIILLTDGFTVTDGGPTSEVNNAFGVKIARAIHDAAYEGIRVHWGHLNAQHDRRDVSFYNTASRDSGGFFSEINNGGEIAGFVDQVVKKGLTNKDEECRAKPQPEPSKQPETSQQPEPSKTPEPTKEPEPSKSPEPTKEPVPTSSCPAPVVSTVTEKVTETVKETVTAPAPTATGNVCFAPCDAPGAKPLTNVKIEL